MNRKELYMLTVGTTEDYAEVKRNLEKMLGINQKEDKYKISKTAKSPSITMIYKNLLNAQWDKEFFGNRFNVYKYVYSKGRSGSYWVKVN